MSSMPPWASMLQGVFSQQSAASFSNARAVVYECRPFCYLCDRQKVLFFEAGLKREGPQRLWTYDLAANRFAQLDAKDNPPGDPLTVLYLEGQDAVLALMKTKEDRPAQWIYSLRHNRRAPPLKADCEPHFQCPYAQTIYSGRHGVLVNLPNVEVMRPDVSKIRFGPSSQERIISRTPCGRTSNR